MDLHCNEFGDRLKYIRELNGINQKELAALTGISNQTISNWERNYTKSISYDDLKTLALHLNCKLGDFLPGVDEHSIDYKAKIDLKQYLIDVLSFVKDNENFMLKDKPIDAETLDIVVEMINSILNVLKIRIRKYPK